MDRLTTHSPRTGSAIPSKQLGDICLRISGCENYDFCEGCPINELLTRLCAYEDTGLTPEQIELLKKPKPFHSTWTGKVFKSEAAAAKALAIYEQGYFNFPCSYHFSHSFNVDVSAEEYENVLKTIAEKISAAELKLHKIRQKVSRYGLLIRGKKYYLSDLVINYFGWTVDIIIDDKNHMAMVYVDDMMVESFDL